MPDPKTEPSCDCHPDADYTVDPVVAKALSGEPSFAGTDGDDG